MNFSDYLKSVRIDEKLGNLNASNNSKYQTLIKAVLKNKYWRGLIGTKSKVIELTGKGTAQLIKDLNKIQNKIDFPQLVFVTTTDEYNNQKSSMIKILPFGESLNIGLNTKTLDLVIKNDGLDNDNPIVNAEKIIRTASGNQVEKRLKHSFDDVGLDGNTEYHAIVILIEDGILDKIKARIDKKLSDVDDEEYKSMSKFMLLSQYYRDDLN
mgnify:CR=1 FL=1